MATQYKSPLSLQEGIISFTIKGTSPLLMNKFSEEEKKGRNKYLPEEEAAKRVIKNGNGLCIPVTWVRSAWIKAGSGQKYKGQRTWRSEIAGCIFDPNEDYFKLLNSKGDQVQDYKVDSVPVVVGTSRIIRHRPKIEDWQAECKYIIYTGLLKQAGDLENMVALLHEAGIRCGIGDNRPSNSNPGKHGRFTVHDVKIN